MADGIFFQMPLSTIRNPAALFAAGAISPGGYRFRCAKAQVAAARFAFQIKLGGGSVRTDDCAFNADPAFLGRRCHLPGAVPGN